MNGRAAAGVAVLLACFLTPYPAAAGPGIPALSDSLDGTARGDGVYRRFDGDLSLSLGVGGEAAPHLGVVRPGVAATLRFYQTVGFFASFHQTVESTDPVLRRVAAGLVIEPLFLLRWRRDAEWGRAFWDLTLDSLSLSLGAILAEPRGGTFADAAGFQAGLSAGLPLLGRAPGPWLRFGGSLETGQAPDAVFSAWARLEWQWFFAHDLLD